MLSCEGKKYIIMHGVVIYGYNMRSIITLIVAHG